MRTTTDERVRTIGNRLLLSDFVTELRTAITNAASGEPIRTDPLFVRAQLASLLREIGLDAEAKAEGEAVFTQLIARGEPSPTSPDSRNPIRALARAAEGAGKDREALRWYGQFVRFGSQEREKAKDCNWCHGVDGPQSMAFFRNWWAGRKFGEYAVKTGNAPALIASHEATLASHPDDVASQLSLAYLYEATGQDQRARDLWSRLNP